MSTNPSLEPKTQRLLHWEFRIAAITVIGGFLLACAVLGYLAYRAHHQRTVEEETRAKQTAILQTANLLCKEAIITAKNFGIVPSYATLTSLFPTATQVTGRYICSGGTNVSQYLVAVDLICRDLKSGRCLALYSVTQPNGTVLYRRQR